MSYRKSNFGKTGNHSATPLKIGKGSSQKTPPNWLMLILSFIVQVLTSILEGAKNRKNRLNP